MSETPESFKDQLATEQTERRALQERIDHLTAEGLFEVIGKAGELEAMKQEIKEATQNNDWKRAKELLETLEAWKRAFEAPPSSPSPEVVKDKRYAELERKVFDDLAKLAGRAPGLVAVSLQGLDSQQAWDMRNKLADREPGSVAASLQGLDSQQAWDMRNELADREPWAVAESLQGLDSQQSWDMRNKLADREPGSVAASLQGLDSQQAWDMREQLRPHLQNNSFGLTALLR